MPAFAARLALGVLTSLLAACTVVPAQTLPPAASPTNPDPTATPVSPTSAPTAEPTPTGSPTTAGQPLLPDPSAEHTVGDTIRLSGGEFVGDQADLFIMEAVMLPPAAGSNAPQYAFLVEITGLDDGGFPYNLLDFSLFDDQSFEYQPLSAGGQQPRLEFGDLVQDRKVRGWLTFDGPADSAHVELQYWPAMALEPALVRVLVP